LVVCGQCGLRIVALYNNDGHAAPYACNAKARGPRLEGVPDAARFMCIGLP